MSRVSLWVSLLAGLTLAGCSLDEGSADLAIEDAPLLAPVSPLVGQPVRVTAEIWNLGYGTSSSTTAIFQIDGVTRVSVPIHDLDPGEMTRLVTSLTFTSANYHTLTVVIDPDETHDDEDRGNNTFISGVVVGGMGDG